MVAWVSGAENSQHTDSGATASTMLHEAGFDTRLIELQLAHQDQNKSRASYDHSARLLERGAMMQAWANMLDLASEAGF